ncbi:hypothetical protein ABGB12_03455 [Actinocorallia sp. B10E7]
MRGVDYEEISDLRRQSAAWRLLRADNAALGTEGPGLTCRRVV